MTQQTQPPRITGPVLPVNRPPTAWESVPKFIRFVTWVYAILAVLSFVGSVIFGLVFVLLIGASV